MREDVNDHQCLLVLRLDLPTAARNTLATTGAVPDELRSMRNPRIRLISEPTHQLGSLLLPCIVVHRETITHSWYAAFLAGGGDSTLIDHLTKQNYQVARR